MEITVSTDMTNETITATNDVLGGTENCTVKFNHFQIKQGKQELRFYLPCGKEKEFVDAICKSFYGTSYSEHLQELDNLVAVIDSKNDTIEELTKEVDKSTNEILGLENIISDLKCVVSKYKGE